MKKNKSYGLADLNGKLLLKPIYKQVNVTSNGIFYKDTNAMHGVISSDGKTILPCIYDNIIYDPEVEIFLAKKGILCQYYDKNLKLLCSGKYQNALNFSEGLAAVQEKDKFGYIDLTGKYIIEPQYQTATSFHKGTAYVNKPDFTGFIDTTGKELVTAPKGDCVAWGNNGSHIFRIAKDYSIIDISGKILSTFNADNIKELKLGGFLIQKGKESTFADDNLNIITKVKADSFTELPNGLIEITRQKHGFSIGGLLTTAIAFGTHSGTFGNNTNLIRNTTKHGYLDNSGTEIIPTKNDYTGAFFNGKALVMKGDKYGYVDAKGQYIVPLEFDDVSIFGLYDQDTTVVVKDEKYGIYDINQGLLGYGLENAKNFVNGLAPVCIGDNKWGYMDKTGNKVIRAKFELATPFYEDHATVKINGKYRIIDKNGDTIAELPNTVQDIKPLKKGSALIKIDDKWGLIDTNGNMLMAPTYKNIKEYNDVEEILDTLHYN